MYSRLTTILCACLLAAGYASAQSTPCLTGWLAQLNQYSTLPIVQSFCSSRYPLAPVTSTVTDTTTITAAATATASATTEVTVTLTAVSTSISTSTAVSTSTATVFATVTTTVRAGSLQKRVPATPGLEQLSSFVATATAVVGKVCTCFQTRSTITTTATDSATVTNTVTITLTQTNTATTVTTSVAASVITTTSVTTVTVTSTTTSTVTYPAPPTCSPISSFEGTSGQGGCRAGCFCDQRSTSPDNTGTGVCDSLASGDAPDPCTTDADCPVTQTCVTYDPTQPSVCAPYADCLGGSARMLFARYGPMRIEANKRRDQSSPLRRDTDIPVKQRDEEAAKVIHRPVRA